MWCDGNWVDSKCPERTCGSEVARHLQKVKKGQVVGGLYFKNGEWYCPLCQITHTAREVVDMHLTGNHYDRYGDRSCGYAYVTEQRKETIYKHLGRTIPSQEMIKAVCL